MLLLQFSVELNNMSLAWSSYHSPKASDAKAQASNAGKRGMAGNARGNLRPPACRQNLVSWTLSIVTLPVPKKNPGKRMMIAHIRQMHQQLLVDCKQARALRKKASNKLDDGVDVTHAHGCIGLYAATPVCYVA